MVAGRADFRSALFWSDYVELYTATPVTVRKPSRSYKRNPKMWIQVPRNCPRLAKSGACRMPRQSFGKSAPTLPRSRGDVI